jgi:hypothetical protein
MVRLNMPDPHEGSGMIAGDGRYRPYNRRPSLLCADMTAELTTIIDLIRYGASRFNAAG